MKPPNLFFTFILLIFTHVTIAQTLENFLSPKECSDLILFSEMRGFEEAKVSLPQGAKMIKGIRNNERLFYQDEELAKKYWQKLQTHIPDQLHKWQAIGLNEQFRFYKYESGQRFKRHIDGRFKRNEQEESRITFMIYLNEDFEGGTTTFDEITIHPKTGTALCFIHEQKHEGSLVTTGCKYVLRSDVIYQLLEA